ncbi:hypothetical protein FGO68_gene13805 [Halteria grandinella]|uniref:C3H1-type domain-containing protein n=1 Tax=Halteria grandinella TaxID=5974 RepID=A0A8J8T240_HALGN|nr:hypothetical protein FGO68_gene13805 [Halteria grandinella]
MNRKQSATEPHQQSSDFPKSSNQGPQEKAPFDLRPQMDAITTPSQMIDSAKSQSHRGELVKNDKLIHAQSSMLPPWQGGLQRERSCSDFTFTMTKNSSQSIPQSYPFISSAKSTLSDASQELENIIVSMFYPTGGAAQATAASTDKAYLQKFRTEICKFWEQTGYCQYGDTCSFAHGLSQLIIKTDVPEKYKTKVCKKFHRDLYCPYGIRCQFIHSGSEMMKGLKSNEERMKIRRLVDHQKRFEDCVNETEAALRQTPRGKIEFARAQDKIRLECFEQIVSSKRARGCRGGRKHGKKEKSRAEIQSGQAFSLQDRVQPHPSNLLTIITETIPVESSPTTDFAFNAQVTQIFNQLVNHQPNTTLSHSEMRNQEVQRVIPARPSFVFFNSNV